MRAHTYATEAEARRAIAAIDALRAPDGTEERVRVVRGTVVAREVVPAEPWSEPMPMQNGDWAVPYSPRKLGPLAGREVQVDGQTVRIPSGNSTTLLEPVSIVNGRTVWRSVPDTPGAGRPS